KLMGLRERKVKLISGRSPALAMALNSNGELTAVSYADGSVSIFDSHSVEPIAELPHDGQVMSIAFSPKSRYLVTASKRHDPWHQRSDVSNVLRIWKLQSTELLREASERLRGFEAS